MTSEEYCHVLSNSDWLLEISSEYSQIVEEDCQFTIRGHGLDDEGICKLASKTLFESLGMYSDKFEFSSVRNIADMPIIWTITHSSDSTFDVINFIESNINGVRFLYHLLSDEIYLHNDDAEISKLSNSLCVHPLSVNKNPAKVNMSRFESKSDCLSSSYSVSLLGIDVSALTQSILLRSSSEASFKNLLPPHNALDFIRPIEERFNFFIGNIESIYKIIDSLKISTNSAEEKNHDNDFNNSIDFKENYLDERSYQEMLNEQYETSRIKIVDLGNACWTYKHFTEDIQTRQYRCPEVILGADYDTSADIWSAACIIFELLTGDLMFDPRSGKSWDRDEDHLALMIELIGKFPKHVYSKGKNSQMYFTKGGGELKHINQLKYWSLRDVLLEKYKFSLSEANGIASFLSPMLEVIA